MSTPAQFYRDQVAQCAASAAGCALDNQRDTFLRAQAAWQALADREERTRIARERREAEKAD